KSGPAPKSGPGFETERIPNPGCRDKVGPKRLFPRLRDLTPVHLGYPVKWVNQPMVHLVNRSTGLDQSTPVNSGQLWSKPVKVGQLRSTKFRPRNLRFLRRKEDKSPRDLDSNSHTHRSALTRFSLRDSDKSNISSQLSFRSLLTTTTYLPHLDCLSHCPSD
ncbi:hypothetical protein PIB30_069146, partial [Stylosanthes scabra]|nr:hypothetical protein [Stylosanthes scabra]